MDERLSHKGGFQENQIHLVPVSQTSALKSLTVATLGLSLEAGSPFWKPLDGRQRRRRVLSLERVCASPWPQTGPQLTDSLRRLAMKRPYMTSSVSGADSGFWHAMVAQTFTLPSLF